MIHQTTQGKRAALMSRVSTDEQTLGYSLDIQSENLQKYCKRNGMEIAYEFEEHFSAKNFNRPAFKEFLKYLKTHKKTIDILLFTTWDRFSRNLSEALEVIQMLKNQGITVNAIDNPLDLSVPESIIMLAINLAMPQVDNERRSIKIREGMRGALKSGRWSGAAPLGYLNSRDEKNKPLIVPGPFAKEIRFIYEQFAKNVSQADIRVALNKKGINIPRNSMSDILRRPVYMGKMVVPKKDEELETWIDGIHEPIITEELFYTVQDKLNFKLKKSNKPNSNRRREELPLRGNLLCSKCGSHLTGSASKGKMGKRYFYYHCNSCKGERYLAEKANQSIKEVLAKLKFGPEIDKLVEAIVNDKLKQKVADISPVQIQNRLTSIKNRINNLQDHFADNIISAEDYSSTRARYETEKQSLESELRNAAAYSGESKTKLKKCLELINNLDVMFEKADLLQKSKILGSTFPEKLFFDGKKCRTPRINEVLRLAISNDKGFGNKKSEQLSENLELFGLVVPRGVEPLLPG